MSTSGDDVSERDTSLTTAKTYVDRQCGLILYLYLFFSLTQRPTYDRLSELHSGCSIHSIVNESFLSRRTDAQTWGNL